MTTTKLNLTRMYKTLVDTYWLEHECKRDQSKSRCHELKSREAVMCQICRGFVTLKQSMRLALEENYERRKNQEVATIQ